MTQHQLIQNAAARVLTKKKSKPYYTVPESLYCLPVCKIIEFKIALIVYKGHQGQHCSQALYHNGEVFCGGEHFILGSFLFSTAFN